MSAATLVSASTMRQLRSVNSWSGPVLEGLELFPDDELGVLGGRHRCERNLFVCERVRRRGGDTWGRYLGLRHPHEHIISLRRRSRFSRALCLGSELRFAADHGYRAGANELRSLGARPRHEIDSNRQAHRIRRNLVVSQPSFGVAPDRVG